MHRGIFILRNEYEIPACSQLASHSASNGIHCKEVHCKGVDLSKKQLNTITNTTYIRYSLTISALSFSHFQSRGFGCSLARDELNKYSFDDSIFISLKRCLCLTLITVFNRTNTTAKTAYSSHGLFVTFPYSLFFPFPHSKHNSRNSFTPQRFL